MPSGTPVWSPERTTSPAAIFEFDEQNYTWFMVTMPIYPVVSEKC